MAAEEYITIKKVRVRHGIINHCEEAAVAGEHKGPAAAAAAEAFANEGWLAVRHHSLSSFGQHAAAAATSPFT